MKRTDRKTRAQRAKNQAEELKALSQLDIPQLADVVIVGAGPAALACMHELLQNSKCMDMSIVILDTRSNAGTTILATGNGRCNYSHDGIDPQFYNDPTAIDRICGKHFSDDVQLFFKKLGLLSCSEDHRLYPYSLQAASVRALLIPSLKDSRICRAFARKAECIQFDNVAQFPYRIGYRDQFSNEELHEIQAKYLILAHGSRAVPQQSLLQSVEFQAILCPLSCKSEDELELKRLSGRRVRCKLSVIRNHRCIFSEHGELLFREYGLSGIVAMNASRYLQAHDLVELDLIPHVSETELFNYLETFHSLDGCLDPAIATELYALCNDSQRLAHFIKHCRFRFSHLWDIEKAQVRRGGYLINEFNPTLEAKHYPGLFACGEACNIDGACGGYNLAWAWQSGRIVGAALAQKIHQSTSQS